MGAEVVGRALNLFQPRTAVGFEFIDLQFVGAAAQAALVAAVLPDDLGLGHIDQAKPCGYPIVVGFPVEGHIGRPVAVDKELQHVRVLGLTVIGARIGAPGPLVRVILDVELRWEASRLESCD